MSTTKADRHTQRVATKRSRVKGEKARRLWRHHGLSIVLFILFAGCLAGQSVLGWAEANSDRAAHQDAALTFVEYLASGTFMEVTMENWESEFLQMFAYVVLTIFLFQKGSSESKDPDAPEEADPPVTSHSPGPVRRGGWQLRLYQHSMSLAFLALFLLSFLLHAVGGVRQYNEELTAHGEPAISFFDYIVSARFWFESLQNWQSEFLSIWAMVVFSIFLRQKGSPESKAVTSSHRHTGR